MSMKPKPIESLIQSSIPNAVEFVCKFLLYDSKKRISAGKVNSAHLYFLEIFFRKSLVLHFCILSICRLCVMNFSQFYHIHVRFKNFHLFQTQISNKNLKILIVISKVMERMVQLQAMHQLYINANYRKYNLIFPYLINIFICP